MNQLMTLFRDIARGFPDLPPRQSMQRLVYWGSIVLMTLVIGFTARYVQTLPENLLAEAKGRLDHHPWLQSMVFVDGRELSLRGEVEPGADLGNDVRRLGEIPGVRKITNSLQIVPKPTPRLVVDWNGEKVSVTGTLTGNDLEQVVAGIREGFPRAGIRDRIRIDDRLGHPLWIPRLAAIISDLSELQKFTFFAWRDQILIDGVADSVAMIDRIRYRAPAGLDPAVAMSLRLRPATAADSASMSLVSGWNGSALTIHADSAESIEAVRRLVGKHIAPGQDAEVAARLDPALESPPWLDSLDDILPLLGQVHDLFLTSAGNGLSLWGRVDDARTLGDILDALEAGGHSAAVQSMLEVSPAGRPAEVSLFKDRSRAVVTGRLPNPQSLALLMDTLKDGLDVTSVENFVALEPNTGFSPWLDRWPVLLPVLPETPFGLSVVGNRALVSGQLPSEESYRVLLRALESMLPDMVLVDWLTVAADD